MFKYSNVDSIHILPPQSDPDPNISIETSVQDKDMCSVKVEDEALEHGRLENPFIPKIFYKNYNGADSPNDEIFNKNNCVFSFSRTKQEIAIP
jgi:hypothetical protein